MLVGHAAFFGGTGAFFVTSTHQHGKQIAAVGLAGAAAMLGDDAVNDRVESRPGAAEAREAGQRRIEICLGQRQRDEVVVEVHDDVDLVIDREHVAGHFGVEERARDDLEGELHHFRADIDGLAGVPACATQGSTFGHDIGISGDALAMKRRSGDAPLAHVEGALAGDEPFAKQDLHAALGALLDHLLRMVDQDFANELRMIDEHDVLPAELVVRDAAVGGGEMLEEQDGVRWLEEAAAQIEEQVEREARWEAIFAALDDGPWLRRLRVWILAGRRGCAGCCHVGSGSAVQVEAIFHDG